MNIIKMQLKNGVTVLVYASAGSGCALKVRITFRTEINLGYLKGTKCCLEGKASFICIHNVSSIASFKPFLIACLREYCTFSEISVVSLRSSPWPKYTQLGTIFQKKILFYYQTFFPLQICSSLDCSQQIPEKNIGGHRARLREKENLFRYRA